MSKSTFHEGTHLFGPNLIHGRVAKISKEHPFNMMILLEALQEKGELVPRNAYWYLEHT